MGDVLTLGDLSHIYRLYFLPDVKSLMRIYAAISQFFTKLRDQINHLNR